MVGLSILFFLSCLNGPGKKSVFFVVVISTFVNMVPTATSVFFLILGLAVRRYNFKILVVLKWTLHKKTLFVPGTK
jgi:hypothetical protein